MTLKELFKSIADAIRGKESSTDPINAEDFATRITSLPSTKPEWLDKIEHLDKCFSNSRIKEFSFEEPTKLKNVSSIVGFAANADGLKTLDLTNLDITDIYDFSSLCANSTVNIVKIGEKTKSSKESRAFLNSAFYNCNQLVTLELYVHDCTAAVEKMFNGCSNLITPIRMNNIDILNNYGPSYMFDSCSKLPSVELKNWVFNSNCKNVSFMFRNCTKLETADLSGWDTNDITNLYMMFYGCSSLTSLDLSGWDTSNIYNCSAMFYGCSSLTSLDLSNWNTSKLTNCGGMFQGCTNLITVDLSNWDLSKLGTAGGMFEGCTSITTLNLSNWKPSTTFNSATFSLGSIPTTAKIITNQTMADWLNTRYPSYTNIEIVKANWEV